MYTVIYGIGTYSDDTPILKYAGAPCESFEEAQELARGHENAKIYKLSLDTEKPLLDLYSGDDRIRAEYIIKNWGEAGKKVCLSARKERKVMSISNFLQHCTACGGDWGAMILTGIAELYPEVYEAIPDDMGVFAFSVLSDAVRLCGVDL